jgi:nicotinate-nucleotide adenylyltransferase
MGTTEQRIAVYGGSFDPVHNGHLTIARKLCELFAFDEFRFMPAHVAPHKRDAQVTPALHRYAMLALATQAEKSWTISTLELDAPERPYTVETLALLKTQSPARIFFIMGADSWAEITTWREWENVLLMCDQVVVTRPENELSTAHVTPQIKERIIDLRGAGREEVQGAVNRPQGSATNIYFTDAVLMETSSTQIRNAVRQHQREQYRASLPVSVADYIEKYQLYPEGKETRVTHVERNSKH